MERAPDLTAPGGEAPVALAGGLPAFLRRHFREAILVVLCLVELGIFSTLDPHFLTLSNILDATRYMAEAGLVALAMSIVIRTGGIDLSVGSTLALASVSIGLFFQAGVPIVGCILLGIAVGALCGAVNGVLVAYLGLVPITVTLGTMALFRGIAYALTGARSFSGFPLSFARLASYKIAGVPAQFLFLVAFVLVMWLVMHRTRFGRYVGAIGYNVTATRYSGVRVRRILIATYTLCGAICALAAVLYTSRVFSARADAALGIELSAITAVVLGGASIMGGRGSIVGAFIAVVLLTYLQNGLIIAGIPGEFQGVVVGMFLLAGVFFTTRVERRYDKAK
jgi:ribose/xylose/arabinose/galactoside ABC-type transport system permease subunit